MWLCKKIFLYFRDAKWIIWRRNSIRYGTCFKMLPEKGEREMKQVWQNPNNCWIWVMGIFWYYSSWFCLFEIFHNKKDSGDRQNRNFLEDNSAWSSYMNGANKWKKLLQSTLTCCSVVVSLHYADVSDHTLDDAILAEGRAAGRCNNSFSHLFLLTPEVAPQQIQAAYRAICNVLLHPKNANHTQCPCWFTGE